MTIEIQDVFGGIGNFLAIVFFIVPAFNIVELCRTKDVSKIPWILFIFTILNCEYWSIYGLKVKAWPIYVCNSIGIFTNHIYLSVYIFYLDYKFGLKSILILVLYATSLAIFIISYILISNAQLVGSIAMIMNIFMFFSPLQNIAKVFELKDNSFIPIEISVCLVLNCITWLTYGILKKVDYFIIIPNGIGLIINLYQIYLWFKFNKNRELSKRNIHNSNSSDEELNKKEENYRLPVNEHINNH